MSSNPFDINLNEKKCIDFVLQFIGSLCHFYDTLKTAAHMQFVFDFYLFFLYKYRLCFLFN